MIMVLKNKSNFWRGRIKSLEECLEWRKIRLRTKQLHKIILFKTLQGTTNQEKHSIHQWVKNQSRVNHMLIYSTKSIINNLNKKIQWWKCNVSINFVKIFKKLEIIWMEKWKLLTQTFLILTLKFMALLVKSISWKEQ